MDTSAEQGSFAIEAAILVPALLLFLLMVIAAGRVETAGGVVDAAAREGARSASLTRTTDAAIQAAQDSAATTLNQEGVSCRNQQLAEVDTRDFAPPVGQTGRVTVTVRCTVSLADLAVPGLPGSITMTSTFTSVVDAYRAR
ncbi:TadE/TadG family type IV pilus assembly protein [Streptacidiphilus sp. N1-12]|uniref:TadE/TadG family type IV pilus assembly protein n=2 Tax=Streptacidiphilus alkalitolerans TaxID=3342712 RepID=A0ABV6VDD1_9ACTN